MQNLKNCTKGRALQSHGTAGRKGLFWSVFGCQWTVNQHVCRCLTLMCGEKNLSLKKKNQPEMPNLINQHLRTCATRKKYHCRERGNSLPLARKHKGFEAWCCLSGIFNEEHQKLDCSSVGKVNSFLIIKWKESTHVQPAKHAPCHTPPHTLPLRVSG